MIRRFNYTGRTRIERKHVVVRRSEAAPVRLDASWTLDGYGFPSASKVFVEAQLPGSVGRRRLAFGSVASPSVPIGQPFADAELAGAYFDLLVVAPDGSARLLGACRRLHAEDVLNRQSPLLHVRLADLRDEVWRLDFDEADGRPILLVNNRIENAHELARTDPLFGSLVFPEVVRRVLSVIVIDLEMSEIEDDDTRVFALWLRWAVSLSRGPIPKVERGGDDGDAKAWIEDVVAAFCREQRFAERARAAWAESSE